VVCLNRVGLFPQNTSNDLQRLSVNPGSQAELLLVTDRGADAS
jgi:hypothetical protein